MIQKKNTYYILFILVFFISTKVFDLHTLNHLVENKKEVHQHECAICHLSLDHHDSFLSNDISLDFTPRFLNLYYDRYVETIFKVYHTIVVLCFLNKAPPSIFL